MSQEAARFGSRNLVSRPAPPSGPPLPALPHLATQAIPPQVSPFPLITSTNLDPIIPDASLYVVPIGKAFNFGC